MTAGHDLNCRELVELITEYLEEALPVDDRARFDRHMGKCRGCTAYVEQMRVTIRLTGRLSEESLDPAARESLLRAFRDWRRG